MKWFKGAIVALAVFLLCFALAFAGPPVYDDAGTPNSSDTTTVLTGFGKQLISFQRNKTNISFAMQVSGRATNDSALVTVQTTNNLSDTSSWINLTAFGGVKVANGTTVRSYRNSVTSADSTFFLGRFVRIMVNHGAAAGSSLAADSSRIRVQIVEWDD